MRPSRLRAPAARLASRLRDESGAGTVFSLFMVILFIMLAGVAVDSSNAWRNQTLINATADSAAHAGAVALALGGTDEDVRDRAVAAARANMPTERYGDVIGDRVRDIAVIEYDPATNTVSAAGRRNAVAVAFDQTNGNGNPVGTFMLGIVGLDSWNVSGTSVAVYDRSTECNASDGIYAQDEVTLTSLNVVGSDFCIHSQTAVWLPQQNTFLPGSQVSMPNLAACKNKCTDSANPGIHAVSRNMLLPDFEDYILGTRDAFLDSGGLAVVKDTFFAGAALGDLAPLAAAGVPVTGLSVGDVVELSNAEFHAIPELPEGLVYDIDCPSGGNGPGTRLTFDAATGKMRRAALVTNCSIHFGDGADVRGSALISTRDRSSATITADAGATVADPSGACNAADRTTVMAIGKMSVPAKFVASNVTLVVDDDVDVASASSGSPASRGLSIYASGRVHMASQHQMESCGNGPGLAPEAMVIRLVQPEG